MREHRREPKPGPCSDDQCATGNNKDGRTFLATGPSERRQMARLLSTILGGAGPQDPPIEPPDRYDLTVNLKTAKTLGLTMRPSILARADEIIERDGIAPDGAIRFRDWVGKRRSTSAWD